jgi:hypothetical protein
MTMRGFEVPENIVSPKSIKPRPIRPSIGRSDGNNSTVAAQYCTYPTAVLHGDAHRSTRHHRSVWRVRRRLRVETLCGLRVSDRDPSRLRGANLRHAIEGGLFCIAKTVLKASSPARMIHPATAATSAEPAGVPFYTTRLHHFRGRLATAFGAHFPKKLSLNRRDIHCEL